MALCSICKKRHAIVFTSRYEDGNRIDEGFCLKCAYESGIAGVTDMFKATGINADNIDEMSDRLEEMIANNGMSVDPGDFLKQLAGGDLDFAGDGNEDDDDTYEFDEDSLKLLKGETRLGEKYEEFYPDQDSLYELFLDTFYEKVDIQG